MVTGTFWAAHNLRTEIKEGSKPITRALQALSADSLSVHPICGG